MKVVVLGSSSAGNSTYVELNNIKFLIDAGFTYKDMLSKLESINVNIHDINFLIVTHAHTDHIKSVHTINRTNNIPIYISFDTFNEYSKKEFLSTYYLFDELDNIMGIKLTKIPISHDKKGFGFIFESNNESLVYITDTGMIHSRYHELLKNKNVYLIESNHNVEMEMNGKKDEYTKIRNIGDEGHLSNEDCAKYLSIFIGDNTKYIELMHISEDDNTYEEAYNVNRNIINKKIEILVSKKNSISDEIII